MTSNAMTRDERMRRVAAALDRIRHDEHAYALGRLAGAIEQWGAATIEELEDAAAACERRRAAQEGSQP